MTDFHIENSSVTQILQGRGIDSKQGVFGNHSVRLGNQPPVRIDKVGAQHIPFLGFRNATRLQAASSGQNETLQRLFDALTEDSGIDAQKVISSLHTLGKFRAHLDKLGHQNSLSQDMHALFSSLPEADRSRICAAMLTEEFSVLDLSLRQEAALNPKSAQLQESVRLLEDIRAQATGIAGNEMVSNDLIATLTDPGAFNESVFDQMFAIADSYAQRLVDNATITADQKDDFLFRLAPSVQNMSNTQLAGLWQKVNSPAVMLLQDRLMASANPQQSRKAEMLFMLHGLALKEISNRVSNSRLDEAIAKDPSQAESLNEMRPRTISEQFAGQSTPAKVSYGNHDISVANLELLAEATSRSQAKKEGMQAQIDASMERRGITMTSQEAGEMLRNAPITINFGSRRLTSMQGILYNPDKPMEHIFHLSQRGVAPKGQEYVNLRDEVEKKYFPQFEGHEVNPAERPTYGALNISGAITGGAHRDYSDCCIVLKPQVKQRATYIFDDSFNKAQATITPERIAVLYQLISAELPAEAAQQIEDPDSAASQALNARLAGFIELQNCGHVVRVEAFNHMGVFSDPNIETILSSLLVKAFCDTSKAQDELVTQENLEVLIGQMDSITQASIGNGIETARRTGGKPVATVSHNYIEAQIHGEIIPSRDFEELIIATGNISKDQLPEVLRQAAIFEQQTGVKVTLLDDDQVNDVNDAEQRITEKTLRYARKHMDPLALEQKIQGYLDHFDSQVTIMLRSAMPSVDTEALFPNGLGDFTQEQRENLITSFREAVRIKTTAPGIDSLEACVDFAFQEAIQNWIGLPATMKDQLRQNKFHGFSLAYPDQFPSQSLQKAFLQWVIGTNAIRSKQEVQIIRDQAVSLTNAVGELMSRQPQATSTDLMRVFADFYHAGSEALQHANPAAKASEISDALASCASIVANALTGGSEPLFTPEQSGRFIGLVNTVQFGQDLSILGSIGLTGQNASQTAPLLGFASVTHDCLQQIGRNAGLQVDLQASSDLDCRFLSDQGRTLIQEKFPDSAGFIDSFGKIVRPAMPAAGAAAQGMPQTHAQRRTFLINMLDQHLQKENDGMEMGRYDHGRGHIARTFILGNAVAGFMIERNVPVDRNLLLCSIAGHDSGRTQGGTDTFEQQSADNTVQTLCQFTGTDSLGTSFEAEVRDLIIQHNRPGLESAHPNNETTVERMLLAAADSLEIGRVRGREGIDLGRNALLKPTQPGQQRSENVDKFLSALADEADLLQKLTNPVCRLQGQINEIEKQALMGQNPDELMQRKQELLARCNTEFAQQRQLGSEQYLSFIESTIRENKSMFPLLSKYYFNADNGNDQPVATIGTGYDRTRLGTVQTTYIDNIQAHLAARLNRPDLIAVGQDVLLGTGLRNFQRDFTTRVYEFASDSSHVYASEDELVAAAFDRTFQSFMQRRLPCLIQANALEFDNSAQKSAFMRWVQSAGKLKSPNEITLIHSQGMQVANMLADMVRNNTLTEEDLARNLMLLYRNNTDQFNAVINEVSHGEMGSDDIYAQFSRAFSMSWSLLTAGDPPMITKAQQDRLLALFDENLMLHARALNKVCVQLSDTPHPPEDIFLALALPRMLTQICDEIRHRAKLPDLNVPDNRRNAPKIPKTLRKVTKEFAAQSAHALRF